MGIKPDSYTTDSIREIEHWQDRAKRLEMTSEYAETSYPSSQGKADVYAKTGVKALKDLKEE